MTRNISFVLLLIALIQTAAAPGQTAATAQPKSAKKAASKAAAKKTPAPVPEPDLTESLPLLSITVEGAKILPVAGIVAESGLKTGQPCEKACFDAARDRLLATGYFETVAYEYKGTTERKGYDAKFEVKEVAPAFPVRFEALPLDGKAIEAALHASDPLYTGRLPGTKPAIDRTVLGIEKFLAAQNPDLRVVGKVVITGTNQYEVQFNPAKGVPVVAFVTFEGSKAIGKNVLSSAIGQVAFGHPFTEPNFRMLLDSQVRPMYEKQGYMRVKFSNFTTSPSTQFQGLDVKVTVEDGPQFTLGTVRIGGPMASDSRRLLRAAKIPSQMTVVNYDEVREGARRIEDLLKGEGYLEVKTTDDRVIDDEKKTVDVVIDVTPGPVYTFGKLTIEGLGLDGDAAIRKMWTLKEGDPFNNNYPDYFAAKVKEDGYFDNLGNARAQKNTDSKRHVVDVTLIFTYDQERKDQKKGRGRGPGGL